MTTIDMAALGTSNGHVGFAGARRVYTYHSPNSNGTSRITVLLPVHSVQLSPLLSGLLWGNDGIKKRCYVNCWTT